MGCDRIAEKLGFYIDGSLDEHNLEEVEAHLKDCAECRVELAALRLIISTAREIEEIEPPADLRMRIASATAAIDSADRPRVPVIQRLLRAFAPPAIRWAAGTAALAAAVCIAVSLRPAPQPITPVAKHQRVAPIVASKPAAQPEPVNVAAAPAPPMTHELVAAAPRAHRHFRHQLIASARVPKTARPKLALGGHAGNRATPAVAEPPSVAETDTTTSTVTVSANDLSAAETAAVEVPAKTINKASLKLASQPAINQEQVQKWVDEAKTQATMHRGDKGSDGLRLLSTRF